MGNARGVRRRGSSGERPVATVKPVPERTVARPQQLDLERAQRLGHKPGHYRVGGAAGAPPVQRLVHAETDTKLYTSNGWADLEEAIQVPKSEGEGTEEKSKKISDFLGDDTFKREVKDRWGVNLRATAVAKMSAAKEGIQQAFWTKTKSELVAEFKERFANPGAGSTETALAKIAQGQADQVANLDTKLAGGAGDREGLITSVTSRVSDFKAQAKKAFALIGENYYLYTVDEIADFVGRVPANPEAQAVFNPVVYMEADEGSSIVEDMNRLHACVLLATLYERGLNADSKATARNQVNAHLAGIKEGANLSTGLGIGTTHFQDSLKLKNEKLYAAAERLHAYFKGEKGINYDLDKNTEKVMEQSGYKMIVSGNTAWENLPSILPRGFTLTAGHYIFMISKAATETAESSGHSNAVQVKQDINAATVIDRKADFFEATNDSSYNFDKDPFSYNVRTIWKKV